MIPTQNNRHTVSIYAKAHRKLSIMYSEKINKNLKRAPDKQPIFLRVRSGVPHRIPTFKVLVK